jgi:hypothetical protein
MRKLTFLVLGIATASACLLSVSAHAGPICFQDESSRVYSLDVAGTFGEAVQVFVALSIPSGSSASTTFLTGGARILDSGQASVALSGVGFAITMTLDPPHFTSGVGKQLIYNVGSAGAQFFLIFTPVPCLDSLP